MMWQLIDRKTATDRGMMYFFTGKPCRNFGNVWLRNTNRGKCFCPDCKKQRREKGYETITPEKRERKREYAKERRLENKEHVDEVERKYRERNKSWGIKRKTTPNEIACTKRWQERNKAKVKMYQMNNRVKKRYTPEIMSRWSELDEFVLLECFDVCMERKELTGIEWSVDHMIPLARGGAHSWDNFQPIPRSINILKKDRAIFTQPHEWILKLSAFL